MAATAVAAARPLLFTTTDGTKLAYRVLNPQGRRTPLVMVQGLSGVKEDWHGLADRLAQTRPVLVFDNRGIGESDVPDGAYTMDVFATDTLQLARHVGFRAFNLMGISMGGMIAQHTAALAPPGTVVRLVLGCTSHGGPNSLPPGEAFMAALAIPPGRLSDEQKRQITENMMFINTTPEWARANQAQIQTLVRENLLYRRSKRGIANQLGAIMTHNSEAMLAQLHIPTLVIHGDADEVVPAENGRLLAAKIKNARLLILPAVGHLFWDMEPERTFQALASFFAEGEAKL